MKLYTEEQVHSAMLLALGRHGIYIPNKHYQDLIDLLTPIELPSDEEINEESPYVPNDAGLYFWAHKEGFELGAKWMRDKIGGNK